MTQAKLLTMDPKGCDRSPASLRERAGKLQGLQLGRRAPTQKGSALIYILIAIALIAALTAVFMQPASQQTQTQNSFKLGAELGSQVQMIRAAIQDCILLYPEGDGSYGKYPLEPDNAYLATPAANKEVGNIRCPGNNPGAPNQNNHAPMFGGSTGRFIPATPALFNPWIYRNTRGSTATVDGQTVNGVFFQISTSASDQYLADAMQKVDGQFTQCEADYIVGNGSNGCANNNKCLRIWVSRVAPTCP